MKFDWDFLGERRDLAMVPVEFLGGWKRIALPLMKICPPVLKKFHEKAARRKYLQDNRMESIGYSRKIDMIELGHIWRK